MDPATAKNPPPREGQARRSLLDRWFGPIRLPEDLEAQLAELARDGSVVFVMRSSGLINYLYLKWLLRRLRLPPLRVAVNFEGLFGWLAAVWRTRRALLQSVARGRVSSVVFLNAHEQGRDPFASLVGAQRELDRPIYLVPLILVWSRRAQRLVPLIWDVVWGSPESPTTLPAAVAFLRNYRRAFLRVGRPLDLRAFLGERGSEPDALLARKVRGTLYHHLSKELRAAVGPPLKAPSRVEEKVMRDRHVKQVIAHVSRQSGRSTASAEREARRDLREVASRYSPLFIEFVRPILRFTFGRLYERVEVDEKGIAELRRVAPGKPLVLCPSHKSHIDYLILSYVFYENGLTPPHVAAGINLAFWPFGSIARRGGAFFIRRSFRGDKIYSATLRAYVKYLLRERFTQEFFPEGGRTRTGKLLFPKTGLFSMEVDAWLDGAADDVLFVPIAVDYERLVEGSSYARELAGGEKKKETFGDLLGTPRVLLRRYGRIYVQFGTPVSLREIAGQRQAMGAASLTLEEDERETDSKRRLVQHLANRVTSGIADVVTVTPVSLVATALLAHVRRGVAAEDVGRRVGLLRDLAAEENARLAHDLVDASADPRQPGPVGEALVTLTADRLVTVREAAGHVIYQVVEEKRPLLDFHRNATLNRFAALSLVALSVRSCGDGAALVDVRERVRWLSRLFKLEFMYPAGTTLESVFKEKLGTLSRLGLARAEGEVVRLEAERDTLGFLADLVRPYLEAYRLAAESVRSAGQAGQPLDRKSLVNAALERGRADYHAGRILLRESLSKATLENAMEWLSSQGVFSVDEAGKRTVAERWREGLQTQLVDRIGLCLAP
ncbi:MAG TPA: 1-acyl-sn-glycerol-3-phosphate acyltransferase [Anaeromyxobacteraceae bacterium]|nr:1-acyl-sn-glycerol-3-phosphate acyltransferase [Anaeromyxobacteraceae bacterium]